MLDTGDSSQDFVIPLDTDMTWCWAYNDDTSRLRYHSRRGQFSICVGSNGAVAPTCAQLLGDSSKEVSSGSISAGDKKVEVSDDALFVILPIISILLMVFWAVKFFGE